MINCLIIDDEPASRDILETYVKDTEELNLVALCKNALEANVMLKNNSNIHLLFLDINMPKLNGMDFYKSLTNPPLVIFTTAYPEYALDGFEVEAVDFLLKPFPYARFLKAVNKASKQTVHLNNNQEEFILFKADKKTHRIRLYDIIRLESVGDYVKVFFLNKSILVHDTMTNILQKLPMDTFIRTHKSHAINFLKLESIEGNILHLASFKVPIGATYKNEMENRLKL